MTFYCEALSGFSGQLILSIINQSSVYEINQIHSLIKINSLWSMCKIRLMRFIDPRSG